LQPSSKQQCSTSRVSKNPNTTQEVSPDPSQVERMLNNIDHEFNSEAPFLIEDKGTAPNFGV
jgi:hypothetical protein